MIVKQILLVSTLGNVVRSVWRICRLMLGCKGLQEHLSQETTFPRTKLMNQLIQLILSSSKQMFCLIYDYQFRVMSLDDLCRVMNGLWMAQNLSQCCSFAQKCIMNIHNPAFPEEKKYKTYFQKNSSYCQLCPWSTLGNTDFGHKFSQYRVPISK